MVDGLANTGHDRLPAAQPCTSDCININSIADPFPACTVIAPLTTLGHWQREIETWTDMNCVVYAGGQDDRRVIEVRCALGCMLCCAAGFVSMSCCADADVRPVSRPAGCPTGKSARHV